MAEAKKEDGIGMVLEEAKKEDIFDAEKAIKSLSEGQKQTYDKLVEMKIKNVTKEQLVKAAQEFGVDVNAAASYLAADDPDNQEAIGEPNFLTSISKGSKVDSVDKKQVNNDAAKNKKDKNKKNPAPDK